MTARQAGVLTIIWRGQNESAIMFIVFTEQRFRVSRKVRGRRDKEYHHSSLKHNPESARNRYWLKVDEDLFLFPV